MGGAWSEKEPLKIEISGLWRGAGIQPRRQNYIPLLRRRDIAGEYCEERTASQSQGYPRNSMDTQNRYVNNFEFCLCSGQSTPALLLSHHNPINTS